MKLCSVQFAIECAFGRLKDQFGILRQPVDINLSDLPQVVYACFVLHNYCEASNDAVNEETVCSAIVYDWQFRPPRITSSRTTANETEGKRVRCILTNYFDP